MSVRWLGKENTQIAIHVRDLFPELNNDVMQMTPIFEQEIKDYRKYFVYCYILHEITTK
jgi:hypothetical protein